MLTNASASFTQLARRNPTQAFRASAMSFASPPCAVSVGSWLKKALSPYVIDGAAASMCRALLRDRAVGQRRSSTALRPSPKERPRPDGRHRARLNLLQHAACATRMLALMSFKPTRPVSGVSQHRWRRRGSTPRWVPFGECALRHVKRCAAASTALTRCPNGPLPTHLPATHSTVCASQEPPRRSRPPPTAPAWRPTSSASPPTRSAPPLTSPPAAQAPLTRCARSGCARPHTLATGCSGRCFALQQPRRHPNSTPAPPSTHPASLSSLS